MKPSDLSEHLSDDHLSRVADILWRQRDSAAKAARWKLGDNLVVIGLMAYFRSLRALALAMVHEYQDWLHVEHQVHHVVVRLGSVPTRFYRGDGDEEKPLPERATDLAPKESAQLSLAIADSPLAVLAKCLRFEVLKDAKGFTTGVNFVIVGHDDGRVLTYPIPRYVAAAKSRKPRKNVATLPPITLDEPATAPQSGEITA